MSKRYVVKKVPKSRPSEYVVYDKIGNERVSSTSILEQDVIDLCKWFNDRLENDSKMSIIIDEDSDETTI